MVGFVRLFVVFFLDTKIWIVKKKATILFIQSTVSKLDMPSQLHDYGLTMIRKAT